MKWFIGSSTPEPAAPALPTDHPPIPSSAAKCPIDHASLPPSAIAAHKAKTAAKEDAAQCPIDHSGMKGTMSALGAAVGAPGALNPVNNMPVGLSATDKAPGQVLDLSTERTMSSIPRPATEEDAYGGGEDKVWHYPSPQQFYVSLELEMWRDDAKGEMRMRARADCVQANEEGSDGGGGGGGGDRGEYSAGASLRGALHQKWWYQEKPSWGDWWWNCCHPCTS